MIIQHPGIQPEIAVCRAHCEAVVLGADCVQQFIR